MDDNIKELIIDYTVGETSYWKNKFSDVLDDIQIHNPEMLVCTCFCDMYNKFNYETYRRWKDNYMDILILMEYISKAKFKNELKHDVLEILLNRNHPIYDTIEYEISLM